MASVDLRDQGGKKAGSRELPAELFEAPVNVPLMHQVVVAGLAAIRRGTHSTKTRAEVRGGGRKPWRQKGTGRARHGSIRSPIWVGGGVAHGPKPRDYTMRVNKKMKKAALRGALTDTLQSGKLAVVSGLSFDEPSTKDALGVLAALELSGRTLVVLPEPERNAELSFRNLPHVKVTYAGSLSVYDLIAADHVLFTAPALDVLEGEPRTAPGSGAPAESLPGGRSAPSSGAPSAPSSEPPVRDSAGSASDKPVSDESSGEDEEGDVS